VAACLELAEVIPTVPARRYGQDAIYDIRGKGWWLS
jgi:hypothetical protein